MPRKKLSLAAKIRNLLNEGKSPKEVATYLKVEPQKVYNVQYHMRKRKAEEANAQIDTSCSVTGVVADATSSATANKKEETPMNDTQFILFLIGVVSLILIIGFTVLG